MGSVLVAAKATLLPLVLDPMAADSFAMPKAAVSHVLTMLLAATLIAYVTRHGRRPVWSPIWVALVAYLAIATASTVLSVHPYTAMFGAYRRQLGLLAIVEGAIFAIAVATFVRSYGSLRLLLSGVFVGASGVLGYGVVQLLGLDPIRWVDATLSSTVGNRGVLAGYLVVACVLALQTVLVHWYRIRVWERLGLIAMAIIAAFEVLASGARGPSLALPLVTFSAIFIGVRSVSSPRWGKRLIWGTLAIAIVAPVVIAPFTAVGPRLVTLLTGDSSTTERSLAYQTDLEAIRARPLLGVGPDGLTTVYLALRPAESATATLTAASTQASTHSWFLDHAVGTGLLGLAAMLVVVGLAGMNGLRHVSQPGAEPAVLGLTAMAGFLGQGIFNVSSVATDWLFWLSVGLLAQPLLRSSSEAHPSATPGRRPRGRPLLQSPELAWVVAVAAVGLGLGSTVTSSWNASRAVAVSNAARVAGKATLAELAAKEAVRLDPGRADHWNVLGLVYTRGEPEKARQAFERAAAAAPYDPVYFLNLAAEEAVLAATTPPLRQAALRHADQAVLLDPYGVVTLSRAAELHLYLRSETTAALMDRAISASPNKAEAYQIAAERYATAGDAKRAAEQFLRVLDLTPPPAKPAFRLRVRAAELLREAGEVERIRTIFDPPAITRIDRECNPTNLFAEVRGLLLPRCFVVWIASEAGLHVDAVRTDSALRVENYDVDGEPLPSGTTIRYERSGEHTFQIQLPKTALPPRPGARVSLRGIADVFGQLVDREASSRSLP